MPQPVKVDVYDKAFTWQGELGEVLGLTATRRHNALSTATLPVSHDSDLRRYLVAAGAIAVVSYGDRQHVAGMVTERSGSALPTAALQLELSGGWSLLTDLLGWPVPANDLDEQTAAYWTATGPAETAVKDLIQANSDRLNLPIETAPDQGRGADVNLSYRFHPLTDRLSLGGLGLAVELVPGQGWVVDVYEPTVHTTALTVAGGTILDGTWSLRAPTCTRVVAGSTEQGAERNFASKVDGLLEVQWNVRRERFIDARDTDEPAVLEARMQEALNAGKPTASVDLTLIETADWSYGDPYEVGDQVPVEVGGVQIVDTLTEAALTIDAEGVRMTPHLGSVSDSPDVLVTRSIQTLARGLHDLRAGR